MTSRVVEQELGESRRTAIPKVVAHQVVRNDLFSMTRSESGAQLTEWPENGQCGTVRPIAACAYRCWTGRPGAIAGYFLW
jgi:hypothetical protein